MKIHIRNARLIDPLTGSDAAGDLWLGAGKIAAVGKAPDGFHANRVIDAAGLIACPGLIDLAVRLREPGYEYKATLESEMAAAVAGGVTRLACPPDTDPPLDEPGLVEMLKYRARNLHQAHVHPVGALTQKLKGERITEMAELSDAGCVGFSQAEAPLNDSSVLRAAMQYAATFGYTVWLRPQDASLARNGVAHDGEIATRLGLPGIPVSAETVALARILILARETGARVHICRISSREGVALVRAAKAEGLPVTCDVSGNHVHLSEVDISFFDTHCHLQPPLRSQRDQAGLREGLADGTIDAICSNHTPVDDDAKAVPFGESEFGASGVELLLALTLKWAELAGITLPQALARITVAPARILGIEPPSLAVGQPADLCLFDPGHYWRVSREALLSQGKNSPFLGVELRGQTRYTLVGGQLVYEA